MCIFKIRKKINSPKNVHSVLFTFPGLANTNNLNMNAMNLSTTYRQHATFERLAQAQTQNTSPKEKPWAFH